MCHRPYPVQLSTIWYSICIEYGRLVILVNTDIISLLRLSHTPSESQVLSDFHTATLVCRVGLLYIISFGIQSIIWGSKMSSAKHLSNIIVVPDYADSMPDWVTTHQGTILNPCTFSNLHYTYFQVSWWKTIWDGPVTLPCLQESRVSLIWVVKQLTNSSESDRQNRSWSNCSNAGYIHIMYCPSVLTTLYLAPTLSSVPRTFPLYQASALFTRHLPSLSQHLPLISVTWSECPQRMSSSPRQILRNFCSRTSSKHSSWSSSVSCRKMIVLVTVCIYARCLNTLTRVQKGGNVGVKV